MKNTCTSCGRKFDGEGVYCGDCLDEKGKLKPFEEVRDSLGLSIAKSQGYAEEPACEIAESILRQQPAWKKRFQIIAERKRKERVTKLAKKWIVGSVASLVVGLIVSISLYYSGVIHITKTIHKSSAPIVLCDVNDKYVFFADTRNIDDNRCCLYKKNISAGRATPISSEEEACVLWNNGNSQLNEKFIVWSDKRHITNRDGGIDLYASDFNNAERRITPYTARRSLPFLSDNWVVYAEEGTEGIIKVFACDISDRESKPEKIFEYSGTFYNSDIDLATFEGETYLAYTREAGSKKALILVNLDTSGRTEVFVHSELSGLVDLHHEKKIFYTMQVKKYDPSKNEMIIDQDSKRLMMYDINTKRIETIRIFRSLSPLHVYEVGEYLILLMRTYQVELTSKIHNPVDKNRKVNWNTFIYNLETETLSSLLDEEDPYIPLAGRGNKNFAKKGYLLFMKDFDINHIENTICLYDFTNRKMIEFRKRKPMHFVTVNKNILYYSIKVSDGDYSIKSVNMRGF